MKTQNPTVNRNRLKPGNYWVALWPNGRVLWGDSVRRNCVRAAKGTGCTVTQRPINP